MKRLQTIMIGAALFAMCAAATPAMAQDNNNSNSSAMESTDHRDHDDSGKYGLAGLAGLLGLLGLRKKKYEPIRTERSL